MPIRDTDNQLTPLDIYIAYEYLPASQYARALSTLDALYETIVREALLDDGSYSFYYPYLKSPIWPRQPWLPLCIDSIETGNSILVRFAVKGESGGIAWRERDLDIVLPRSTAPLCAMAVMLSGGMWGYDKYLQAEKTKAETQNIQAQTDSAQVHAKLTAAQVELTRAQTAEILQKHLEPRRPPKTQPERSVHIEIHSQIQNFYSLANQPNITKVEVNGVDVREISDRTE